MLTELYQIRQANDVDIKYFIKKAKKEGWNPGLNDGPAFFSADPKGFFIGEYNNERISCISAVRYNGFGFIGLYMVEEDFRGYGFGLSIWQRAMNYLDDLNIGLDGVVAQQDNYKKSGFTLAHTNMRFKLQSFTKTSNKLPQHIVSAPLVNFENLLAYDAAHFPSLRENFLKSWLATDTAKTLVYQDNQNNIKGLGTIRQCYLGFKIGPLYAESPEIAEKLFLSLLHFSQQRPVFLDISTENHAALALVEKYNMEFVFETARMYTEDIPALPWDEVYGITSFELG
ncbi:hypothetical protein Q5O24_01725 [Eubacteriaceae bacterium ES3]|nr:hypothetical protein Q5O24_01725 [Eubacteriaceae bacterium ES3]